MVPWSCSRCTLENPAGSQTCSACGASRGADDGTGYMSTLPAGNSFGSSQAAHSVPLGQSGMGIRTDDVSMQSAHTVMPGSGHYGSGESPTRSQNVHSMTPVGSRSSPLPTVQENRSRRQRPVSQSMHEQTLLEPTGSVQLSGGFGMGRSGPAGASSRERSNSQQSGYGNAAGQDGPYASGTGQGGPFASYTSGTGQGGPYASGTGQGGAYASGTGMATNYGSVNAQGQYASGSGQAGILAGGRLKIQIFGAHDLTNTDLGILPGDVSDPFLQVQVGKFVVSRGERVFQAGKLEFQTEVIDNNLNPVWKNNKVNFLLEHEDEDHVKFEVFNSNTFAAHDSLGSLLVPISDLVPGQVRHFSRTPLEGGDRGKLDVEMTFFTAAQVQLGDAHGGGLMPPGVNTLAHMDPNRSLARLNDFGLPPKSNSKKIENWVPLPSFTGFGPEAFEPPPRDTRIDVAPVGEARRRTEYQSSACHLGQYDYSEQPVYYPKQELVNKRQWLDDPFYGWRNDLDDKAATPGTARRYGSLGDEPNSRQQSDSGALEHWHKDPFHGWLKFDEQGNVDHATNENETVANVSRQLMSLPSFREAPRKRFEDHREYVNQHEVAPRRRLGDTYGNTQLNPEKRWKDDAFFGWLPGRGMQSEEQSCPHRPLQQARLRKLPSFSEHALAGMGGRGAGVLRVWINGLHNLQRANTASRPNACVKLSLGSQEQQTPVIESSSEPRWNTGDFAFEVESMGDRLILEVLDVLGPEQYNQNQRTGGQPIFMGRHTVDLQSILSRSMQTGSQTQQVKFHVKERLHDQDRGGRAEIDFDWRYEPYKENRPTVFDVNATGNANPAFRSRTGTRDQGVASIGLDQFGSRSGARDRGLSGMSGEGALNDGRSLSNASITSGRQQILGTLSVRIIAGYNLVNMDSGILGDVSDPYVTMQLASDDDKKKRKRTQTINNNLNPVWNSNPFLFPIKRQNEELILEVYDDDTFSAHDFLGKMIIPLVKLIAQPNMPVRIRDNLTDISSGELEVEVGFSPG
eukprot:CAMPEP_0170577504 /NCGR_PEP_ID=MMETSP0224-20130122/4962_1 /TAXON_ID=285029 /ORGANISM="Togula jolla, Strain CCCM 725" /LENGTH=1023 /DNA_ID=CAMNT_0010900419 /DNA_START=48 /DNA_END=3119 /DNA_ORIENTATION=+